MLNEQSIYGSNKQSQDADKQVALHRRRPLSHLLMAAVMALDLAGP